MRPFVKLFKQWIFWMLFFALQRLFFLFYYSSELSNEGVGAGQFLLTFIYALKLDISTACYILVIPFIFQLFNMIFKLNWFDLLNRVYTYLVLILGLLISIGEVGIYKEWNSKLSYKALVYLKNPAEVIQSAQTSDIILYILILVLQLALLVFVYNKFVQKKEKYHHQFSIGIKLTYFILMPVLLLLGIRGGFGAIPITASQSYFSNHNILNLAAVNPLYNIAFSMIEYSRVDTENHFHFMPDEEANEIVKNLYSTEKDTTIHILNLDRPNIVVIFLESWSGDLIESLGGVPGLTPKFHELEKEGILFTEFYATGNRSQQALASVFSGFPAIPITTLSDYPQKYGSVGSLIKELKTEGYYSSFYFGGDLNYGNIRSYLVYNEFDKLIEEDDFSENAIRGKLGVHDEGLFDKMFEEIENQTRPFFTAALTLSSHSPYDQPGERPINNIEFASEYVNSAWYTDKCLGEFITNAKQTTWYDSTLIIIMSDHSHLSYNNYQWWSFDYRRIPLLLLGGALKPEFQNSQINKIADNAAITNTILKQLKLNDSDFFWSRNLFNPYSPEFAYFELNDGFGWKTNTGKLEYNVVVPYILGTNVSGKQLEELKSEGKAYIQVLFEEFLSY